jgi:hypothetical protein
MRHPRFHALPAKQLHAGSKRQVRKPELKIETNVLIFREFLLYTHLYRIS